MMKKAYIFPGQGSQFPGMAKELYEDMKKEYDEKISLGESIDDIKQADALTLHEKADIPLSVAEEIYSFFHGSVVK